MTDYKYHIKADGTPGVCKAYKEKCPLGKNTEHFSSYEEAERVAQQRLEEIYDSFDEEPYSMKPQFINGPASEYEQSLLNEVNLDGLTLTRINKPGYTPEYRVNEAKEQMIIKPDSSGDTDWIVNNSRKISNESLNNELSKLKDKKRLKEVTRKAVHQFKKMRNSDVRKWELQKRIRENEIAGDFLVNKELKKKAFSKDPHDRVLAAEGGYHLEQLANDKDELVRSAVAASGQQNLLNKLSKDKSDFVRATVIDTAFKKIENNDRTTSENYELIRNLANDESPLVRHAIAYRGVGADQYVNDPDPSVRKAVAMSGNHIETLSTDKDQIVRFAAISQYPKNMLSQFENDESKIIREYVKNNKK